jgi:tRNA (guanine37-N1)-methyltransferase
MHLHIISLFPEIFDSFLSTSLLQKAQEKKLLSFHCINPRKYCTDKHQQIDDQVYGGGAGMLIKAQPIIDAVEEIINNITETSQHHRNAPYVDYPEGFDMKIIFPSPSVATFTQKHAYAFSKIQHLIFICGRYEGIDHRFEEYMETKYPTAFQKISLGQFVLLGGEVATMTMIEAITRLVP